MWRSTLAAAALAALVSCASPGDPSPGPTDVTVELDAFSGLPNPRWTLEAAEAAELASRLRDLPPSDASLPEPILGYRGFWIENPGGVGGIPESVYVSRAGLVMVANGRDPGPVYRDTRGAERWLLDQARRRGHEVRAGSAARLPGDGAGPAPR